MVIEESATSEPLTFTVNDTDHALSQLRVVAESQDATLIPAANISLSGNGGTQWTTPVPVEESGDRPDFAFLGLSPDGADLYVAYDGFTDPFQTNTTDSR